MTTFLHYAINVSLGVLAAFGVAELVVFLAAVFVAPAEFDWPDEETL